MNQFKNIQHALRAVLIGLSVVVCLSIASRVVSQETTAPQDIATTPTEQKKAERTSAQKPKVIVLVLNDESINPITSKFLIDGISDAEEQEAPVLIQLDTPGGLLQSTREVIKKILSSKVPVIVYVHPSGSRAASAGLFITYASHVAAMSPSTNIGAAHVVGLGGGKRESRRDDDDEDDATTPTEESGFGKLEYFSDDVMEEKVMKDALASIEGIARLRGRNVEWAKEAMIHNTSVTAEDALELNAIEFIASDTEELLEKIDGRTVEIGGSDYTLQTAGARIITVELNTRQRILNVLANPNFAYLLMMMGFAALMYEITHPGTIIPGVAGAIMLLLAAFSLQMLPTNYAAILLLMAGIGLIVAEIFFTSYGLLTLAGAVCLFIGSLALFEQQGPFGVAVSLSVIIPVLITVLGLMVLLVYLVATSHKLKPATGLSAFIGEIGEVTTPLEPEGKVFFNGSYWDAVSQTPLARGAKVRIVAVERLRLFVEPVN